MACPALWMVSVGLGLPRREENKMLVSFKSEQISKECLEVEEEAKESKS